MKKLRRTMLFMPGNNPGMIQNAGILGADSIILDLEDAVSITEKDAARILVKNAIKNVNFYETELTVRINPLSTAFGFEDLDTIARVRPDAIMVPKATVEDIKTVCKKLEEIENEEGFEKESIKIFPLIESAFGLENIYDILRASPRIVGMLLGAEDLTADLEIKRSREGEEIFYARNRAVVACRACKVDAIDTPFSDMEDMEGFIKDIQKAKSLGMTGKAAINPRQIDTIHHVFAPSESEIIYAQRVMMAQEEAKREGKGVFSLDGKMVDAPIIARAQNILNKAKLAGLI